MKLIVGLGNPGRRYSSTPHNVGYEVVDELARRLGWSWRDSQRVEAQLAEGSLGGSNCVLMKPTTYMNSSGDAVAPFARQVDAAGDLLVILDDVDLPLGRLRLRASGSAGTHNGLRSVVERVGTREFSRLRCGVASESPEAMGNLIEYVLARWPGSSLNAVQQMVQRAADVAQEWVHGEIGEVMTKCNSWPANGGSGEKRTAGRDPEEERRDGVR